MDYFEEIISYIVENKPSKKELARVKINLCSKHKRKGMPTDIEILLNCPSDKLDDVKKFLMTKPVRTSSGVSVVAIMSKPERCPHGACIYCPSYTEKGIPSSYTGAEPATMRGLRNHFDSYLQVFNRLEQYVVTGHMPDKVELIIMGGTFPAFEWEYQKDFVSGAFRAMNDFSDIFFDKKGHVFIDKFKEFFLLPGDIHNKEREIKIKTKITALRDAKPNILVDEQKKNESSFIRCIGLTIETKPDWGFLEHGNNMLELGCTRVELGVQSVYDDVIKSVNRGHTIEDTKKSIAQLRDLGFKLNFHLMPGLPGVDKKREMEGLKEIFSNPAYCPDMVKIYPCMVMPNTPLEKMYLNGKYKPLSSADVAEIIAEFFSYVPMYCRVMRVQRDIPTYKITAGVDKTNLRQYVDKIMKEKGTVSKDIRNREVGLKKDIDYSKLNPSLGYYEYDASGGKEYFISFEDSKQNVLFGFIRMRFPNKYLRDEITPNSAIIRELHVYGSAVQIGDSDIDKVQHTGIGKKLLAKAEEIAREHGKKKMIIISGIGVRGYYYKQGYILDGPYVSKKL